MRIFLKRLLYRPLAVLDCLLQLVLPVRARRLCYTSNPDYGDNAYHLFRHTLQTRNNLEHVWLMGGNATPAARIHDDFKTITAKACTQGNQLLIVKRHSLRGYLAFLTSQHVFHTHGMFGFSTSSPKRNIVSLWHGMPIKCIGDLRAKDVKTFTVYGTLHIATSGFFRNIIAHAHPYKNHPRNVLICQQPRCDALLDPASCTYQKREICQLLGLPLNRQLVLWMPTYRTEPTQVPTCKLDVRSFLDDLAPELLNAMNDAAKRCNATVVIKLHISDRLNDLDTPLEYSNIHLLKAENWQQLGIPLYELVAASDALLSDISSILIDYLLAARSIGIIGLNPATYTRDTTFPLDYLFNSSYFQRIQNAQDCERFMQSLGQRRSLKECGNDIARIFHDTLEPGSETILKHLGL